MDARTRERGALGIRARARGEETSSVRSDLTTQQNTEHIDQRCHSAIPTAPVKGGD